MMWPSRFVRGTAATFAVVVLTASVPLVAACDDDDPLSGLAEVQAELVAPPGVPEPLHRGPAHVVVDLAVEEKTVEIAPDVDYRVWTFNGSVPGPMIRVRVGDQVEVRLDNPSSNQVEHNIDLHAVNGPGGGAGATSVAPGESSGFFFEAKAPGLYVYHCAAGIVADHVANGMFGAILVEPETGMEEVDHEYYIGQGEFYTTGETGEEGEQEMDAEKLLAEEPPYVVFNGHTAALQEGGALTAETGETVRLFVANGGPNYVSSFHVIGEIFDTTYNLGSLDKLVAQKNVQTTLVPPGGSAIVEFKVDVPGDYRLVDHALSRVSKGALGILRVTGEDDPQVFRPFEGAPAGDGHDAGGDEEEPPDVEVPEGATLVAMHDNSFEPDRITVAAGERVTFALVNEGRLPHNMRIADENGDYDTDDSVVSDPDLINAGETGELTWTAPSEPGTFDFRCDIHPVEMVGTITIE
jgi:nitrite reductase (NO-forming)